MLLEQCKKCKFGDYDPRKFTMNCTAGCVPGCACNRFVPNTESAVNHPSHYNHGKIEVIEYIEDKQFGFNLGNAIKYISRCEHKGRKVEDLEKAIWYIQREITLTKQKQAAETEKLLRTAPIVISNKEG